MTEKTEPATVEKVGETTPAATGKDRRVILFATKTCPNCKMAEKFLQEAGIAYEKIYADDAKELTESLGIRQAPTLAVMEGDVAVEKIVNVSNIRKYTEAV